MGLASFNRSRRVHGGQTGPIPVDELPPEGLRPVPLQVEPRPAEPVLVTTRDGRVVEPISAAGPTSPQKHRNDLYRKARDLGAPVRINMTTKELEEAVALFEG